MFSETKLTLPSRQWLMLVLTVGLAVAVALSMVFADDAEAKKKKKKKRTTVVSRTFTNTGAITIPAGAPATTTGPADPYPSPINVAIPKLASGVLDVNVTLKGLSHTFPDNIDVMLTKPGGPCLTFMSDSGGADDVSNINLTFDDEAANFLPGGSLLLTPDTSGTFKPTNSGGVVDNTFIAPAPNPNTCGTAFTVFDGINPNGEWRLFVFDDGSPDVGSIANGWSLDITARVRK